MNTNLAILAGGIGSRIKKITKKTPKPLIKINNREFIKYIILLLVINKFKNIKILVGYKKKLFKEKLNNTFEKIKIRCISENKPLGTGGALNSLKKYSSDFLVVNGDSLFKFNFDKFLNNKKFNKIILVKNTSYKSNNKLNNIFIKNSTVYVTRKSDYMNGGFYFLKKEIINKIEKKKLSLENDIILPLIYKKKIKGEKNNSNFLDIGTPKNLSRAPISIKKIINIKAVLFDRDGTINKDLGYVHKFKDFKWLKGAVQTIRLLNYLKIKVIVITNQSGIGRGFYSHNDFKKLNSDINNYLKKFGAHIDDWYYCPVNPDDKKNNTKKKLFFRKPQPGMILKCMKKYQLDKNNCFFIGDKKSDALAAKSAGIKFYIKENYSLLNQILKNLKNFIY